MVCCVQEEISFNIRKFWVNLKISLILQNIKIPYYKHYYLIKHL